MNPGNRVPRIPDSPTASQAVPPAAATLAAPAHEAPLSYGGTD